MRGAVGADTLQRALSVCEREFFQSQAFSILEFVNRLASADAAAAQNKQKLFGLMMKARVTPEEELCADPGSAQELAPVLSPQRGTSTRAMVDLGDGWETVFNALLEALFDAARRTNPVYVEAILDHLTATASSLKIGPDARREVVQFARSHRPGFTSLSTKSDFSTVLHAMYVWTCSAVGPIEADRMFHRAVREAESHPAAGLHPPSQLL